MTLESCWRPTSILFKSNLYAMQGRLDALEQRMLSKMDRALAKFLEKQLGMPPIYATHLHVTCFC